MQYSNYPDTASRDTGSNPPVDASAPALPAAAFSGAYRPATPPPLDLTKAPLTPTAASIPATSPYQVGPDVPETMVATSAVSEARTWFRGKHVVIGVIIAVVLAGGSLFALRSAHHKTTASAARQAEATDPATTRSVNENFQRLDAGLTAIDASLAEQSGNLAE